MNAEMYETVWTGATWRNYPAPQIAQEPPSKMGPSRVRGVGRKTRLLQAFTGTHWVSLQYLTECSGVSTRHTGALLEQLKHEGRIEELIVPASGSRRKLYRRRQAQTEAA